MTQSNKPPLFIIVLALANLALPMPAKAVDSSDTFYGTGAGNGTTTGVNDSAFGYLALLSVTTGNANTAGGAYALSSNTTGSLNTANGFAALYSNTTGGDNTANGEYALVNNTTGSDNTASGLGALNGNTIGSNNTATGYNALYSNTTGNSNLANGYQALYSNTTGTNNMATGTKALYANTTGFYNMANGGSALFLNTTGNYNVAEGLNALYSNTTGSSNIAIGINAGGDLTTGGYDIDIGNRGVAAESRTIRLGTNGSQTKTYIAGIGGVAVSGSTVTVNSSGQLGVMTSSRRFKRNIQPMSGRSDVLLKLEPVMFQYKAEVDPSGAAQFGLVAEQVEKIDPALVTCDGQGKPYTVRYEAVNAMLLNEFLKAHKKVEDLEAIVAQEREEISLLKQSLKAHAAQIATVSEQLTVQRADTTLVATTK
jgi:hypothetical protein